MNTEKLAKTLNLEILTLPDPDHEVEGVYAGDLISWVMGRADQNNAWVTIMTNQNVIAVASLLDLSCVILTEEAETDPGFVALAGEKGVNLLRTPWTTYETCVQLSRTL